MPSLDWTFHAAGDQTAPAVLVLPGGGYSHLAAHEGEPVAEWLASLGLHAAVLRLFRQRLQRRAPEIDALDGEAQVLALAEATALPATRVQQALRPQGLQHPATFTQSIATLLQMRSRL